MIITNLFVYEPQRTVAISSHEACPRLERGYPSRDTLHANAIINLEDPPQEESIKNPRKAEFVAKLERKKNFLNSM